MVNIAVEECINVESNNKLCAGTAGNLLMFSHLSAGFAGCVNREQARAPSITRLPWPVCTGHGPIHLMEKARGNKLLWGSVDFNNAMIESHRKQKIFYNLTYHQVITVCSLHTGTHDFSGISAIKILLISWCMLYFFQHLPPFISAYHL